MSSPAGPRPGLAPLSRDAPSLRAARKDPSVPSRRCHRAACEDGHTFQPPSPRLGRKAGKQLGVLGFRLPRGVASGGLCPSARGLAGLGPPLPCASSIRSGWACIVSCRSHLVFRGLRCECVEVQGGCGSHCGGRGAGGLWARAVRVDCDSCSFSAPSDSQVRCGSGRQAGLTVRPVDSTQRHVTATT